MSAGAWSVPKPAASESAPELPQRVAAVITRAPVQSAAREARLRFESWLQWQPHKRKRAGIYQVTTSAGESLRAQMGHYSSPMVCKFSVGTIDELQAFSGNGGLWRHAVARRIWAWRKSVIQPSNPRRLP